MDNRNVHIDELFRDRFDNEADQEGIHQAWNKMEQLLDQEKGRRKFLIWGNLNWFIPVVLLLAGGAGVAYWMNQPTEEDLAFQQVESPQNTNTALQQSDQHPHKNEDGLIADYSGHQQNLTNTRNQTVQQSKKSKDNAQDKTATIKQSKNNVSSKQVVVSTTKKQNNIQQFLHPQQQLVSINEEGIVSTKRPQENKTQKLNAQQQIEQEKLTEELQEAADNQLLVVDKKDNNKIKKVEVTEKEMLVLNERIKKDELQQTTSYYYDTAGYKKIQVFKMIPLTIEEIRALQGLTLVQTKEDFIEIKNFRIPQNQEEESLVASNQKNLLTKSKGSTNKQSTSFLNDINNFFEIKSNYYASLFGGFNVSPRAMLPLGFHAGAGVHFWMRDKWTVGTELAYLYKVLNDSYTDESVKNIPTGSPIPVADGYLYNYRKESNKDEYRFSFLNSFELPILFGYHTDRWNVFAGPSFNYTSKIRYRKHSTFEAIDTMVVLKTEGFDLPNTQLQSVQDDFKARVGLGYIVGAQYSLTDRLGLNFRLSQTVHDNSSTQLGKIFSNRLNKSPNFIMGLHYKLNSDKKIKYIIGQ